MTKQITCRSCGWEIVPDFDLWSDSRGGVICFWDNGVEKPHQPLREKEFAAAQCWSKK